MEKMVAWKPVVLKLKILPEICFSPKMFSKNSGSSYEHVVKQVGFMNVLHVKSMMMMETWLNN